MRYTVSVYLKEVEDAVYRNYVCNSLQGLPEGKVISLTYSEILNSEGKDEKTGDEIAQEVINELGLVVRG